MPTTAQRHLHHLCDGERADGIDSLDNDAHDTRPTENLVRIDFQDTPSDDPALECVARAMRIAVCRQLAEEMCLCEDHHPLFCSQCEQLAPVVADTGRVRAAHRLWLQAGVRARPAKAPPWRAVARSKVLHHAC